MASRNARQCTVAVPPDELCVADLGAAAEGTHIWWQMLDHNDPLGGARGVTAGKRSESRQVRAANNIKHQRYSLPILRWVVLHEGACKAQNRLSHDVRRSAAYRFRLHWAPATNKSHNDEAAIHCSGRTGGPQLVNAPLTATPPLATLPPLQNCSPSSGTFGLYPAPDHCKSKLAINKQGGRLTIKTPVAGSNAPSAPPPRLFPAQDIRLGRQQVKPLTKAAEHEVVLARVGNSWEVPRPK